ncbi:hypothetical protein I7103_004890 [Vibrio parahaemolyticus]|nr:hypothetical protein [Vibrio parahaemolyticus]
MLTKRLRRIHNAWRSRFKSDLVFKVQWFRCGGGVVHHLTRRYVLRRKLENWCNYKLGSNPDRERRLMWEY